MKKNQKAPTGVRKLSRKELCEVRGGKSDSWNTGPYLDLNLGNLTLGYRESFERPGRSPIHLDLYSTLDYDIDLIDERLSFDPEFDRFEIGIKVSL